MHRGAKASSAKVKDGKNANAENGGRINVKRVKKCDVLEARLPSSLVGDSAGTRI